MFLLFTHHVYIISFGTIVQAIHQHILNVGNRSSHLRLGKLFRNKRIEPNTTGTEKRMEVDDSIIHLADGTFINQFNGTDRVKWNMQMASQSITRTRRDDSQSCICIDKCTSHLIHSSVSSDGTHHIGSFFNSLTSQSSSMTRIFRFSYYIRKQ